jgi:hypothetical protein
VAHTYAKESPANWAAKKPGTFDGAMPAKLSENTLATAALAFFKSAVDMVSTRLSTALSCDQLSRVIFQFPE